MKRQFSHELEVLDRKRGQISPKIQFLDEATSHLDVARERRVNEAIRQLNLTRVIIAHRPGTIAAADRVIDLGHVAMAA